ncbi:MAG: TIGR03643 family protein [Williamsia sp.]|nr:TIGR03643 family protein [Williamsia sp.]
MQHKELSLADKDRIIEMAWEDRTPFEAITAQFGLSEAEVIDLMRQGLKRSSFNMWRQRVQGRSTKHEKLRDPHTLTFKSDSQRQISLNKISKR